MSVFHPCSASKVEKPNPVLPKDQGPLALYRAEKAFYMDRNRKSVVDLVMLHWPTSQTTPKGVIYLQHGFRGHSRSVWYRKGIPDFSEGAMNMRRSEVQAEAMTTFADDPESVKAFKTVLSQRSTPILVDGSDLCLDYHSSIVADLNTEGFDVIGIDLPGHGLSGGERVYVERFQDWFTQLDAIISLALSTIIQARGLSDDIPIGLMGSSLGANLIFNMLQLGDHSHLLKHHNIQTCAFVGGMFQVGNWLTTAVAPILSLLGICTPNFVISSDGGTAGPYPWLSDYSDRDTLKDTVGVRARMFTEMKAAVTQATDPTTFPNLSRRDHPFRRVKFLIWANGTDNECEADGNFKLFSKLQSNDCEVVLRLCNARISPNVPVQYYKHCPMEQEGLDIDHTLLNDADGDIVKTSIVHDLKTRLIQ